jgi:hypothetical protein
MSLLLTLLVTSAYGLSPKAAKTAKQEKIKFDESQIQKEEDVISHDEYALKQKKSDLMREKKQLFQDKASLSGKHKSKKR